MSKLIFTLIFLFSSPLFGANSPADSYKMPDSLSNMEGIPSSFAYGCVNVITGDYVDGETDIALPGIDPLTLQRFYSSSSGARDLSGIGWSFNHHGYVSAHVLEETENYSQYGYDFCDHRGSKMHFIQDRMDYDNQRPDIKIDETVFSKGVTNCGGGEISGRTNLKNIRLYHGNHDLHATDGSGTDYRFQKFKNIHRVRKIDRVKLPSFNRIVYGYDEKSETLKSIKMINRGGSIISSLNISKVKDVEKEECTKVTSSDGKEVKYKFIDKKQTKLLVSSNFSAPLVYLYAKDEKQNPIHKIIRKELPEGRYKNIQYFGKKDKTLIRGRVESIQEPAGTDQTLVTTASFTYELDPDRCPYSRKYSGKTHVLDALQHKTTYAFNNEERLTSILRHDKNNRVYTQEDLYWRNKKFPENTYLAGRSLKTGSGLTLFSIHFDYNQNGNIICQTLYGNLKGNNQEPLLMDDSGIPKNKANSDEHKVSYTYTGGGRNLMTSETHATYKVVYKYHKEQDDLLAKFILADGSIRKRHFYAYDCNGAITREIVDDGNTQNVHNLSGVTERQIKHIVNTLNNPSGLPEIITEAYLDLQTQQEVILRKTRNSYDIQGNMISQEVFGADQKHAYTLYWEYDVRGNVTKEIDALGQVSTKRYDANNNFIYEQGPCLEYHHEYAYDFMDRMIRKEKVANDGTRCAETYRYDVLGNKIASTDRHGNETQYHYDEFNRLTSTLLPPIALASGEIVRPSIMQEYDPLGNITVQRTANEQTRKSYTIGGKPYLIDHADGTQERFQYLANGDLKRAYAKNGTLTVYFHDYQSRPVKISTYAASGELIAEKTYVYNAFHLLNEVDESGLITTYRYDGAGRLIETRKGSQRTEQFYDALGRAMETHEYAEEGRYISKIKVLDLLNKMVEERTEDEQGRVANQINYIYDADGNVSQTITYNQAGASTVTIRYNIFKDPIEVINAKGDRIFTTYDYFYKNNLNQRVCCSQMTDSLGNVTISVKDALGRIVKTERKNPYGIINQKKENFYDQAGHLEYLVETLFTQNLEVVDQVKTRWIYNSKGQLASLIEAEGTSLEKRTGYAYNGFGQKEKDLKPDGSSIEYFYDPYGRLSERKSSDSTIHELYSYNSQHNLTKVEDLVSGLISLKDYDENGWLTREQLGNGLVLQHTYDPLGRPVSTLLPDGSEINYIYDACRMKGIHRKDVLGNILYVHTYESYDLSGHPTSAQMIGNAGQIHWNYDILGRLQSIETPHWTEKMTLYDAMSNLIERSIEDRSEVASTQYSYDDLYQLKSEQGPIQHQYTHDSRFNRTSKDGQSYSVNVLNQLTSDGEWQYEYDACGRMSVKKSANGTFSYGYDALDRLTTLTCGNDRYQYIYDSENRRISKEHYVQGGNGLWQLMSKVNFFYDGQNEIGACDTSGAIVELRILGEGKGAEIGAAIAIEIGDQTYAPLHDHNGNVMGLIDSQSGQVLETYQYTAFGQQESTPSLYNPWRFSSKRHDEESGLIYFGRRYYDPAIGRWITPDPIGFDGGPNLYAYVLNNPLTHIDLYGLEEAIETITRHEENRSNNVFARIYRGLGRFLRTLGDHAIPIPYVHDGISYLGHRMAGGTHKNFRPICRNGPSRYHHLHKPELFDSVRIIYVNGMLNNKHDCYGGAEFISKCYGDTNVHYLFNTSHGFSLDVGEIMLQKLGFRTRVVDMLVKNIQTHIRSLGGVKSDGCIILYGSSQGGLVIKNALKHLTPAQRHMISVVTLGSASLITGKDLKSYRNYVNSCDPIPIFGDPLGFVKGMITGDGFHILKSKSSWFDHSIDSENYRSVIRTQGFEFMKEQGNK